MKLKRRLQKFLGVDSVIREVTDRMHGELVKQILEEIKGSYPEDFDVGVEVINFRIAEEGGPFNLGREYDGVEMTIRHNNPHESIFCERANDNKNIVAHKTFKHHWEMGNHLNMLDWCKLRATLKSCAELSKKVRIRDLTFEKHRSGGFNIIKTSSRKRLCLVNEKGMMALKQWITEIEE